MTRIVDLTVAIATRQRPVALRCCLEAVLAGSVLPAEILVVDQSEDDATAGVATRQLTPAGVELRYLRQTSRGLSHSRNAAFRDAARAVIAVTDDDCIPDVQWLEVLARELRPDAAIDAVGGRVLPLGPEVQGMHAVSSRTSEVRRDFFGKTVPWEVGTGANFCVRRDWLTRIGGYDVRLGAGSPGHAGEDMDVIHRLLNAGARIRYEPGAVVYHERQPSSRRARSRYDYGYGLGACCGLWIRERVPFAVRILGSWIAMRMRLFLRPGGAQGHSTRREELQVLRGTAAGLGYGLRVGGSRQLGPGDG